MNLQHNKIVGDVIAEKGFKNCFSVMVFAWIRRVRKDFKALALLGHLIVLSKRFSRQSWFCLDLFKSFKCNKDIKDTEVHDINFRFSFFLVIFKNSLIYGIYLQKHQDVCLFFVYWSKRLSIILTFFTRKRLWVNYSKHDNLSLMWPHFWINTRIHGILMKGKHLTAVLICVKTKSCNLKSQPTI